MSVSRRRDTRRRAVARRRSASVSVVAALVLLCAVVSAGTGLGGSVAALDDPAAGSGQAPEWPFRGIVHNVYSESDGHPVLRYWSTATGESVAPCLTYKACRSRRHGSWSDGDWRVEDANLLMWAAGRHNAN